MKYIIPILFLGFVFANCRQELEMTVIPPEEQLATDLQVINLYLKDSSLTDQVKDLSSTLRFIVEDSGRGPEILVDSSVNILLKGAYLEPITDQENTDSVVDYNTIPLTETGDCSPVTLFLLDLIPGFREGVQQFNTWGKGTLLIPSALGYGQSGTTNVPPFSVLVFEIEIVEQEEFDRTKIKNYIAETKLTPIDTTETGIYYSITKDGNGEQLDSNSTSVIITYNGYYADSTSFDLKETPVTFNLSEVIPGWQKALPILEKGGSGTFLIPSNLAYGPSGSGSIPSNTMLIYDITLVDFN